MHRPGKHAGKRVNLTGQQRLRLNEPWLRDLSYEQHGTSLSTPLGHSEHASQAVVCVDMHRKFYAFTPCRGGIYG
eukprot:3435007-Prymnesium_polylepis.1